MARVDREIWSTSGEDDAIAVCSSLPSVRRAAAGEHLRLYFALPKGGKTRIVDMPRSVATELAAYFLDHPAVDDELP